MSAWYDQIALEETVAFLQRCVRVGATVEVDTIPKREEIIRIGKTRTAEPKTLLGEETWHGKIPNQRFEGFPPFWKEEREKRSFKQTNFFSWQNQW